MLNGALQRAATNSKARVFHSLPFFERVGLERE
jgi:hypothetical protein